MNTQRRALDQHVELESTAYWYAFFAEVEVCASGMWRIWAALRAAYLEEESNSGLPNSRLPNSRHLIQYYSLHLSLIRSLLRHLDGWFRLHLPEIPASNPPPFAQVRLHVSFQSYLFSLLILQSTFWHMAYPFFTVTLKFYVTQRLCGKRKFSPHKSNEN